MFSLLQTLRRGFITCININKNVMTTPLRAVSRERKELSPKQNRIFREDARRKK